MRLLKYALLIASLALSSSQAQTGWFPLVQAGGGGGGITTVYSNSTVGGTDSGIAAGISIRIGVVPGFGNGTNGQVRVTLRASNTANAGQGIVCDHVSVGVATTAPDTAAIPVEVKFGGVSGVSLTSSLATQTSDFSSAGTPLSFTSSDTLVIVCDENSGISWNSSTGGTATVGSFGPVYYHLAATSWNVATTSGFTSLGTMGESIVTVETQ